MSVSFTDNDVQSFLEGEENWKLRIQWFLAAENENQELEDLPQADFGRLPERLLLPVRTESIAEMFCVLKITAIVCFCGVSTQFFFLSISADGLYDFYSVIVDPLYFHSLMKLTFLASKDFCVYMIKKIIHGRAWIWNFSSCVQLDISLARSAYSWSFWGKHSKRISISTRAHVLFSI